MNKKISLSLIAALSLTTLHAVEFKPVGFKATGMGGTGVASTRGSISGYYNPALLRYSDYTTEISLGTTVRVRESNLIDNMDKLSDLEFDQALTDFSNLVDDGNVKVFALVTGNTLKFADGESSLSLNTTQTNGLNAMNDNDSVLVPDGNGGNLTIKKADGRLFVERTSTLNGSDTTKLTNAVENIEKSLEVITKQIGKDNGFMVSASPTFAAQISDAFAIGMYANVDVGFRLNVDKRYDELIIKQGDSYYQYDYATQTFIADSNEVSGDQTPSYEYENKSLEYANENQINYVEVNSMTLGEIPISYARAYDFSTGSWSFGLNLKPMTLTTHSHKIKLGESSEDADENLDDYETTYDSTIGLDLGFAYRPKNSKITIGLVGKNINSPTFKVDESKTGITEDHKIDPMARIGLSVPIWNDNIEFAVDADLTKNKTLVEDEESQYVGAGIELHPASWFALRFGAMQDMAATKFDDGMIMTAGLGFGLKWFQVDLSLMASSEQGQYDGDSIPRYISGNLSLVSKWGEGYNRKSAPAEENKIERRMQQQPLVNPEDRIRIKQESQKAFEELDRSM